MQQPAPLIRSAFGFLRPVASRVSSASEPNETLCYFEDAADGALDVSRSLAHFRQRS